MSNKVNISTTTNTVTITPQNTTNITTGDTSTSVTVSQESAQQIKVQTLGARGPQGPKGDPSDQADSIYVDIDNGDSAFYIPMMGVPTSDTYYGLKLPTNFLSYTPSTNLPVGNPLKDIFGDDSIDKLTIGRGSSTAGAIFLNSTVDKPSIVFSDEPLYIQSYDELYLTASDIHLNSSVHIPNNTGVRFAHGAGSDAFIFSYAGQLRITGGDQNETVALYHGPSSEKLKTTSDGIGVTGEVSASSFRGKVEVTDDNDQPNQYILTANSEEGAPSRSLHIPSIPLLYTPETNNIITGLANKAAKLEFGSGEFAGAIQLNSNVGDDNPNFISTLNNPLYIKPKQELYLSGSAVVIDNLPTVDPETPGQLYTTSSDLFGGPSELKVLMVS